MFLRPHILYSLELLKFSLASCAKLGYFYQEAVNFRLIMWLFDFIGGIGRRHKSMIDAPSGIFTDAIHFYCFFVSVTYDE